MFLNILPERVLTRLMQTVARCWPWVKRHPIFSGTVAGLPILLYLALGTSVGLHWWHVPWPDSVSCGLLGLMAFDAALMTVVLVFSSALLFLGLRQKKVSIPSDRLPSMVYAYLVLPFQYGLITLWGSAAVTGNNGRIFLEAGLILFLVSFLVRPWLELLWKGKP